MIEVKLTQKQAEPEDTEQLQLKKLPFLEAFEMVMNGTISIPPPMPTRPARKPVATPSTASSTTRRGSSSIFKGKRMGVFTRKRMGIFMN